MSKFFRAIRLTESFTVKFGATPSDILSGLKFIMEDRSADVYGQKTRRFVGRIEENGFSISRRSDLFQSSGEGFVSATGKLKQVGEHVLVEAEVGVNTIFKVTMSVWIFIIVATAIFIVSRDPSIGAAFAALTFLAGFLFVSLGLVWIFTRITVESFKKDLERNFHKILG